MNRYNIGKLSKTFSLSSEAIRFYEKKGLLMPKRSGDGKGYRYYTSVDFQRVASIKRLQNEGLRLDEIFSMHTGVTEATIEGILQDKVAQFAFEIAYKQKMFHRLQDIQWQMSHLGEVLLSPQRIQFEPVYFRVFDCLDDLWQAVSNDPTLLELFKHLPLASISTPLSFAALRDQHLPKQRGVSVPESFAKLLKLDLPSSFIRIDATHALRVVFRIDNGQTDFDQLLCCVRKALASEQATIKDLLFTRLLTNYIDVNGVPVQYSELYIPLVENKKALR